jgi:methionyl-tRNA formyltransferase
VRYAIFTTEGEPIASAFFRCGSLDRLAATGIELAAVVIDSNDSKRRTPLANALAVARRRARLTQCSLAKALLRGTAYRLLVRGASIPFAFSNLHCPVLRVGSLNNGMAACLVRDLGCDVVCLMGTRILTARTLDELGSPAINIHSSDPAIIRGGPPVVWEVLAGLNEITLTIHEVAPQVDTGRILIQHAHAISFCGGLGSTIAQTMDGAAAPVAGLFDAALRGLWDGSIKPRSFEAGSLRTIPTVRELIRADRICRRKSS